MNPGSSKLSITPKTRLLELDVFRGIAALYVVLFHLWTYYADFVLTPKLPLPENLTGLFGVQLFFMISGFVILMTLEHTKKPVDFVVARFSRLFPAYWTAVILAFISIRTFNFTEAGVSVKRAMMNFSMVQHWVGVENIDGVYWSLSIEVSFYLTMFVLLFVFKKLQWVELLGVGWLLLMLINTKIGYRGPHFMDINQLLKCGHLFLAGIVFYRIKTQGITWYRYVYLGLCLLTQFIVKTSIHDNFILDPVLGTTVVFIFFLAFYLFVNNKLAWINYKPLIFFGTISYSLYLTHESISCPIMKYLHYKDAPLFFLVFVPLMASMIVAIAVTFFIEQPAMHFIRNKYKNWQRKRMK